MKPQTVLFGITSVIAGVFDVMEDVEKGERPGRAIGRALKKTQKRIEALEDAAEEIKEVLHPNETCSRPFFELCPCGCALPKGQCMGKSAGGR